MILIPGNMQQDSQAHMLQHEACNQMRHSFYADLQGSAATHLRCYMSVCGDVLVAPERPMALRIFCFLHQQLHNDDEGWIVNGWTLHIRHVCSDDFHSAWAKSWMYLLVQPHCAWLDKQNQQHCIPGQGLAVNENLSTTWTVCICICGALLSRLQPNRTCTLRKQSASSSTMEEAVLSTILLLAACVCMCSACSDSGCTACIVRACRSMLTFLGGIHEGNNVFTSLLWLLHGGASAGVDGLRSLL